MTTNAKNKTVVANLASDLIAGTAKHLTTGTSVPILGASYTPAEITTKLQAVVTLRSDVDDARASTKAKVATETSDMPALRTFMAAYESYLMGAYGSSPDVLADFGITKKARTPPTVEAKAAAVAKRAATRAARHTMGSVQKKKVTGNVTGVTVTPITSTPPTVTPPTHST